MFLASAARHSSTTAAWFLRIRTVLPGNARYPLDAVAKDGILIA
jgi:hypothetical protein